MIPAPDWNPAGWASSDAVGWDRLGAFVVATVDALRSAVQSSGFLWLVLLLVLITVVIGVGMMISEKV